MMRLFLLAICGLIIFGGFALPFAIEGMSGLVIGGLVIIVGASFFWHFELRTNDSLKKNTMLNKTLNADGENLIERE